VTLLPCGDAAFLIEVGTLDQVLGLRSAIADDVDGGRLEGVIDIVPAARTILVRCHPAAAASVARHIRGLTPASRTLPAGAEVRIEVRYDGADLGAVATHCGLDPSRVIRLHTEATWTVAFTGFAPGFAYLVSDDDRLHVPRRPEPRTRVPAGSVGLAGEFSGVYPRASPGGWQLIGRTTAELWRPERRPAALLTPGTRVRFIEVAR
jgi:KipI family sensor histidine kinase inhibitor